MIVLDERSARNDADKRVDTNGNGFTFKKLEEESIPDHLAPRSGYRSHQLSKSAAVSSMRTTRIGYSNYAATVSIVT